MNEKMKNKLSRLKGTAKKYVPAALGIVGTVVATTIAIHYRRELIKWKTVYPDEWPSIEVHPELMKDVENGATLKFRRFKTPSGRIYCQFTTLEDFDDEANAKADEMMKEKA